jgi:NAD(P)-dependent dehydrogenase (short-subunit alcohol dehydrogenase family)
VSDTVLRDRVAVITGAAGKLGPVWVRAVLEAGGDVLALTFGSDGTSDPSLRELKAAYGDRLLTIEADVTVRDDLAGALATAQDRWGAPPHILVNNAGIDEPPRRGQGTALEDIGADAFLGVLQVNVVGAFQAMQVFGAAMKRAGRGAIINIGSLYAAVSPDARMYDHIEMDPPFIKPPAYGASKSALLNLTRYFATHLAPEVRVNSLSPGGVAGGQDDGFITKFSARVPLGRLADPAELAGPLTFLASDASSYVTALDLKVDGGFTAW